MKKQFFYWSVEVWLKDSIIYCRLTTEEMNQLVKSYSGKRMEIICEPMIL